MHHHKKRINICQALPSWYGMLPRLCTIYKLVKNFWLGISVWEEYAPFEVFQKKPPFWLRWEPVKKFKGTGAHYGKWYMDTNFYSQWPNGKMGITLLRNFPADRTEKSCFIDNPNQNEPIIGGYSLDDMLLPHVTPTYSRRNWTTLYIWKIENILISLLNDSVCTQGKKTHTARTHSRFHSTKWLGVNFFLIPWRWC